MCQPAGLTEKVRLSLSSSVSVIVIFIVIVIIIIIIIVIIIIIIIIIITMEINYSTREGGQKEGEGNEGKMGGRGRGGWVIWNEAETGKMGKE